MPFRSFAERLIRKVKGLKNKPRAIVIKLDYNGVPWVYYTTINDGKEVGFQRNPVTTALKTNEFYDLYKVDNNESSKM